MRNHSQPPPSNDGLPPFPVPEDDEDNLSPDEESSFDPNSVSADLPDLTEVEAGIKEAASSVDTAADKLAESSNAQVDAINSLIEAVEANTAAMQSDNFDDGSLESASAADRPDRSAMDSMLADDHGIYTPPHPEASEFNPPSPSSDSGSPGPSLFDSHQEKINARLGLPSPNRSLRPEPVASGPNRQYRSQSPNGGRIGHAQYAMMAIGNSMSSVAANLPSSPMGPGIASSAASGAMSGGMTGAFVGSAAGPVGSAVGAGVGAAAGAAVAGINSLARSAEMAAENLGQYSAQMSEANAEANFRQIIGNINRAQAIAPEVSRYTTATSKLGESAQDLQAAVLQAALKQVLPLLESLVDLIETHGEAFTEELSRILEMIVKIVEEMAGWGFASPILVSIARGMSDTARNLREINERGRNEEGVEVDKFMQQFLADGGVGDDPLPMAAAQGVGFGIGAAIGAVAGNQKGI